MKENGIDNPKKVDTYKKAFLGTAQWRRSGAGIYGFDTGLLSSNATDTNEPNNSNKITRPSRQPNTDQFITCVHFVIFTDLLISLMK